VFGYGRGDFKDSPRAKEILKICRGVCTHR
jgi:hypothetical protein